MKRKFFAILMVLVLILSLAACGEEKETTLTGMVVSVDGTVISLLDMGDMSYEEGDLGELPEGMGGFGGFNPEEFGGTMPEGETFPSRGEGERPEMPEGMEAPEGMEFPEGMTMSAEGEMPDFGGENGGMFSGFADYAENMETTDVDIADAHISVEIDGGKASGSLEDVKAGTFVTITMNGKGKVTNVLVSSQSGFGGRR